MSSEDLFFSDITGLAKRLGRGTISAVELADAFCDRLERLGPRLGALAEPTRALARRQARAAQKRFEDGTAGPLTGIPWGAKDLLDTAKIPTRWGAPQYADRVPDRDATVVAKLHAAGAVLTGKLAMVELAGGGGYATAAASATGPCMNPWDTRRWAGGSSSGSGAAVAAGLVPFALGSETSGSIMTPAAFCGVTGLRPTHGAVSRAGAMALSWSCDKVGPLARSAADCATVLQAICGRDDLDPTTADWTFTESKARAAGLRIGVPEIDLSGSPELAKAFETAVRVLRKLGVKAKRVKLPAHNWGAISFPIIAAEWAHHHRELIESDALEQLVDEAQVEGLRRSLDMKAADYAAALEQRVAATRDLCAMFQDVDALAMPTGVDEAPPLDRDLRTGRRIGAPPPKRRPRRRPGGGSAVLGAVTGVPALSVPMGFGKAGMPLGLSFIGDRFGEATILRLGQLFQRETDWHLRRPPEVPSPPERAAT